VEEVEVAAGNSSLTGNIAADIEGKRPKIKGTVSAKLIDISELNGIVLIDNTVAFETDKVGVSLSGLVNLKSLLKSK
jgi:hypothetical protein